MPARHQPLIARTRADTNVSPLDAWSLAHAAWGTTAGVLGLNPWAFLAATAAYEVLEFVHESPRGSPIFGSKRPESPANLIADVGVAALAYGVARALRDR